MLPLLSGAHILAPAGRHSMAISQEQAGQEQTSPVATFTALAAFLSVLRVAIL